MTNDPSPENNFNQPPVTKRDDARALEDFTSRLAAEKNNEFLAQQRKDPVAPPISAQESSKEDTEETAAWNEAFWNFETTREKSIESNEKAEVTEPKRELGRHALIEVEQPLIPPVKSDDIEAVNEPSLLAEEVDLWPEIYTNEDLDKAWEEVKAVRGDIEPSIKNLNAISVELGTVPPPGIIQSRLDEVGGLKAFQARHGYTEPTKEAPSSRKHTTPEKDSDQLKTAERLKAANLWLTRFRNAPLSVENIIPAAEDGRYFTLEQIDEMGGLELLSEDIEALRTLTDPSKQALEVQKIKAERKNRSDIETESEDIDDVADSIALDYGSDIPPLAPIDPVITPESPDSDL